MMNFKQYKNYPEIRKDVEPLFVSAFPIEERPDAKHYFASFDNPINKLFAFYEEGVFVGFTSVVEYKDICYIFFLAVKEEFRNQGYGSRILSEIKKMYQNYVLLLCYEEVDEKYKDNAKRIKRAGFYAKNGFISNNLKTDEFGVIFQTAYYGKHTVPFEDYQQIFAIGFGEWTLKHLKKYK